MDLTISDLVEQTGVAARTIREWIRLDLLPRPSGYGPAALYTKDHLLRIWAVLALRKEGLGLEATKEQLASMSARDLGRYRPKKTTAPPGSASGAPSAAPTDPAGPPEDVHVGAEPAAVGPGKSAPRLEASAGEGASVSSIVEALPGPRYALIQLLPGLVLMVDERVSGITRRTALEIVERYRATTG